jgi:hypothetical protein
MLLKHVRESPDINSLLSDENLVNEMRSGLKEGDVYITRPWIRTFLAAGPLSKENGP